ncbi:MAG: TonB-dependent receptor [Proteobacteria bacterium]|nr:TonB-dependent receptor [Pseudomonadota bacterium]
MFKTILGAGVAAASLAWAAQAAAADAAATADTGAEVQELVVVGRGETRQVQAVTAQNIEAVTPGSSPLKVVALLPGVNFQSADAFGAYEWSTRISVRGFNQNQLGFTLDDVPLGDMSYGNYNGLHISRAISSENIASAQLAQGAAALDVASSSNLGGAIRFVSRDPSDKFGVYATLTGGSWNTFHGFVRLDSGELPTGGRAYVSYGYQHSNKWKGDGVQKQQQVNAKIVQPVGPATVTAFLNYSDRRENDYQDLSLSLINRLGYNVDNISNNWALAEQIAEVGSNRGDTGVGITYPGAGTTYPTPYQTVDDVYFNASGLRKDIIGGAHLDWAINDQLKFKLTGYGHHNDGQGLWYTPYTPSPSGAPISIRTTEYDITRGGVIASLSYTLGANTIEGGVWYEDNNFNQARRFYGLDLTGTNRDSLEFQSNPFFTQWAYAFNTQTVDLHLQDTWQVNDALKINFGFKTLRVKVTSSPIAGTAYAGQIESNDNFLPQAGFNWRLNGDSEVFGDYTRNMRAFVGAATSGPFSASPTAFAAIKDTLKPEKSDTFELGYRLHTGGFEGAIAAYDVKFHNRLLVISQCAGIVGCFSALGNVGGVTSYGLEAIGAYRFEGGFSVRASYAYNHSTYDDDVINPSPAAPTPTKGKTVVDTPRHIANIGLAYEHDGVFGGIDLSYQSRRFFTYLNDQSVPSRVLVDLNVGYRFQGDSMLKGTEVQLNITNLFDKRYVSTVGSNGFSNSGDGQTLLAGAPREVFVTVRKQF